MTKHRDASAWIGDLVLELRLRGASGRAIGDAVAVVEAHCADSGEHPDAAFGDPVAYARALGLPDEQRWSREELVANAVGGGLVTVGTAVSIGTVIRALAGHPMATFSVGSVVGIALVLVLVALVPLVGDALLRLVLERPLVATAAGIAVLAGVAALSALLPAPLVELPVWPALAIGLALLVGAAIVHVVARRRGLLADDPIVPPEAGAGAAPSPSTRG